MQRRMVELHGCGKWAQVAEALNAALGRPEGQGRSGKQCRERWCGHLRPDIRTGEWTEEEDRVIVRAHKQLGNRCAGRQQHGRARLVWWL